MKRPVSPSLSPNLEGRDIFLALKLFFSPWNFFSDKGLRLLEIWFRNYFGTSFAIGFNSGRSCLFAILRSLGIGPKDEVLIQAFTCIAVPNSIIWTGAKPVYVDIDSDLTINTDDLERKINKKTKAIVVQHTFGIPAKIGQIAKIAKKNGIPLIEDCAHTIGGLSEDKKLGSFGDISFFSFGRDKAFSSVFGGVCITNNQMLGKKLRKVQRQEGSASFFWTLQQLFHPIAFFLILPLYNFFSLGKIILVFFQKVNLLSLAVSEKEKHASASPFIKKMPSPLCYLALEQLKRIKVFNKRRLNIGNFYINEFKNSNFQIPYAELTPFLRFPLLVDKRKDLIQELKKKRIHIDKWYSNVIDPKGTDFKKIFYEKNSCPNAERISGRIINLPTNPTLNKKNIQEVVYIIKNYD